MKLGGKTVRWQYEGNSTTCEIKENKDLILATGVTKKFHKDLPNKRLGRDQSFRKAMTQAAEEDTISKIERKAIWNDYRNNINQPV